MESDEIEQFMKECLDDFYHQRVLKLNELSFNDILQRINPYLLEATNMQSAAELIEDILAAVISSSDEKIFVDSVFAPLATWLGNRSSSSAEGVDVAADNNTCSVKKQINIYYGQAFWEELTGDADFYLKIIRLMSDYPLAHRVEYLKAYGMAVNRFTKEFLNNFSNENGDIDWEKLVEYNSGKAYMVL